MTAAARSTTVDPFLRWAGSKRIQVPYLSQFWSSEYRRYVEPFAGSAALFFALDPPRALLGDLNGDLIDAFRTVSQQPSLVSRTLRRLPTGEAAYYCVRASTSREMTPVARAARFIYLNRFCFNGIFRTNRSGAFNVPYGAPRNGNVPTLDLLKTCGERLRKATLLHADFRKTLSLVRQGDFVYLDPPYAVSNRRVFVQYGEAPFTTADLSELAELLVDIQEKGAHFVVSYADCREARKAFAPWPSRRIPVRRNIAGFSSARREQYELCASNSPCVHKPWWQ